MSAFNCLKDRLFLFASAAYAANRWVVKPRTHNAFMHNHFNDLLLIPCALPPLLLLQTWMKLRPAGLAPTPGEIGFHLLVWSVLFEFIGPHIMPWTTGDPWDVAAYVAGGVFAGLWWHRRALASRLLAP
jgi:hypothetical protein